MLYTPYVWPLLLAGFVMLSQAIFVRRFKTVPAALPHAVLMASGAAWAFDYALAICTASLSRRVLLGNLTLVFGLLATTSALVMVLEYVGAGYWLTRRRMALLAALPAALGLLALTSPWHALFRYGFSVELSSGFASIRFSTGPLYLLFIAYQSLTPLAAIALMLSWSIRGGREIGNSLLVSIGIALPFAAGILYAIGLSPIRGIDLGPMMLVFSGLCNILGIFGGRFLETAYIARSLVIESIEDPVIVLDPREHLVDLNRAAEEALGIPRGNKEVIALSSLKGPWADMLREQSGLSSKRGEATIDEGRDRRIYDLTITPIMDGRLRPLGRLIKFHDITKHKEVEEGLRESEEKFRMLAETTSVGMFIFDGKSLPVLNSAFQRITGYSASDLEGIDPYELIHPEHRDMVRERAAARLQGRPLSQRYDTRIITRDGEERWVDFSVARIAYRGKPALLATFLDVTESRKMGESLRESRALYLGIVEDQTDPVSRWLPDTTLTFVNNAYCEYFGQPREQLIGRRFASWLPPESRALVEEAVGSLMRREAAALSKEEMNIDRQGRLRCAVWAYRPIEDDEGRIIEFQSVGRDITDRKNAERELRGANEELSAQLEMNKLLQARLFEQAVRDVLTGLFNRRYMQETLEREAAGSSRGRGPISIIMMDLDFFKRINDDYGHKAGDMVLASIGRVLTKHTRRMDIACRYGGEEFVVILPATSLRTAGARAEVLRRAVEELSLDYEGLELRVTISLGVAAFPLHGETGDEALKAADHALYEAKAAGRNRVVLYR